MKQLFFINYESFIMIFTLGFRTNQHSFREICKLTFPLFIVFKLAAALVFLEERQNLHKF